ncbi:MAG: PRC-barrel domain-containing protein [Woeseia sp.]
MNKLKSMKYPIVLMSAFAMGTSMAAADDTKCDCPCDDASASVSADKNQDRFGVSNSDDRYGASNTDKDQDKYSAANADKDQDRYGAANSDNDQDRYGTINAEKDKDQYGVASAEKDKDQHGTTGTEMASDRANPTASSRAASDAAVHGQDYLKSKPAEDYFSESLIGLTVTNRRDNNADVGTVDELLIDKDGQIAAVIVSLGGVMGIGEKDLAIAWDQIERKVDGDEITLSVDLSEASLSEAPSFDRE